jgi:hypothetical protein
VRVGAIGTMSRKDGLQKIYVDCDKEFYDTYFAARSFVYSDNERIAFIMSNIADESSHFGALRELTLEVLKSGKVEKKTYQTLPSTERTVVPPRPSRIKATRERKNSIALEREYWRESLS